MSISYIPEENEYKNLTPFKRFVLESFPWIDANFDAMTNYELMGKIIEYLNDVIANENALQENMTNLYDFVNDYFSDLDVQEEINKKLDEMAKNGSLTSLIATYIGPFVESQNQNIEEQSQRIAAIQNQVNKVASGSPAGVYATASALASADPDHSKIYVVTADGKWYYYNGTQWTVGGTYQGTELVDGSVSPRKLSFSQSTNQLFDCTSPNIINGWIGNNLNGTISSSASSYIAYIPCLPNTTYTVTKLANTGSRLCVVETEVEPSVNVAYSNKQGVTDPLSNPAINNSYQITTSSNGNYIAFFFYNSNADTTITLEQAEKGIMVNTGSTALPWEPYALLNIDGLIEKNNISNNKLNESYLRLYEGSIDINFDNSTITIETENFIGETGRERLTVADGVGDTVSIAGSGVLVLTATITGNSITAFQLENYQSRNKSHPIILWVFAQRQTWFAPFYYGNRIKSRDYSAQNVLSGKKMGGLGDSLIKGSNLGNTYTSLYKIAQNNNMTYVNYGINGNPISNPSNYQEGNNTGMCVRYDDMDDDLDYIVVLGGANDKRLNVPIGTNDDNVVTTFKGALNILIQGLLTKYPSKKILFMTNYNRTQDANSLGLYDIDYVDAMIEMCALYGIPCFDNYRKCGISWKTNIQTSWCDEGVYGGGSINRHLSPDGYDFLIPVYESLLKGI